jgi:hypothetical protein
LKQPTSEAYRTVEFSLCQALNEEESITRFFFLRTFSLVAMSIDRLEEHI